MSEREPINIRKGFINKGLNYTPLNPYDPEFKKFARTVGATEYSPELVQRYLNVKKIWDEAENIIQEKVKIEMQHGLGCGCNACLIQARSYALWYYEENPANPQEF